MAGTATDGRASLAGMPSWDIKSTRETHVPVVIVLTICLDVPAPLPALLVAWIALGVMEAVFQMLQPACCFLPLVLGVPGVLGVLSQLLEILEVVLWAREVVVRVRLHMLTLVEGGSSWVPVLAAAHTVQKVVRVVPRIGEGLAVLAWEPALEVVNYLPAVAWLASTPVLGVVR